MAAPAPHSLIFIFFLKHPYEFHALIRNSRSRGRLQLVLRASFGKSSTLYVMLVLLWEGRDAALIHRHTSTMKSECGRARWLGFAVVLQFRTTIVYEADERRERRQVRGQRRVDNDGVDEGRGKTKRETGEMNRECKCDRGRHVMEGKLPLQSLMPRKCPAMEIAAAGAVAPPQGTA